MLKRLHRLLLVAPLLAPAAAHAAAGGRPADGFWYDPAHPGTGLHLQLRGDTLVVSRFSFVQPFGPSHPSWDLGVVQLQGRHIVEVDMYTHYDGSCFGCAAHAGPAITGPLRLTLEFMGARRLLAHTPHEGARSLIAMPFGGGYVDVELGDIMSDFGALPLPDLAGTWAFAGPRPGVHRFGAAEVDGDTVRFTATGSGEGAGILQLRCKDGGWDVGTGCRFEDTAPSPSAALAFARLDYIDETRIRFEALSIFHAVRIPAGGPESSVQIRPADGFWADLARPGTGLNLQTEGTLLAVALFDQIDGTPRWRIGTSADTGATRTLPLHVFEDGSCFGCEPHEVPRVVADIPLTLQFGSARRARATLANGSEVKLVNLPFGVDYVDLPFPDPIHAGYTPLPLPDLAGIWALDGVSSLITLGAAELRGAQSLIVFSGATGGMVAELQCRPGTSEREASCEYRQGDAQIGTPPPGAYPTAVLGDIEEDRIRFRLRDPDTQQWRIIYAVRVPTDG